LGIPRVIAFWASPVILVVVSAIVVAEGKEHVGDTWLFLREVVSPENFQDLFRVDH